MAEEMCMPSSRESQILRWVEQRRQEVEVPDLFDFFIAALATFIDKGNDDTVEDKDIEDAIETSNYENDYSLFEISCLVYIHVDLWLFNNRPSLRKNISEQLLKNIIEFNNTIFSTDKMDLIAMKRINEYGTYIREGDAFEKALYALHGYVLRCKQWSGENSNPFDSDFVYIVDLLNYRSEALLRLKLQNWVSDMVPVIIEYVKEIIENEKEK